jgi:N-acetylmuramoyl-L-alanine amidase
MLTALLSEARIWPVIWRRRLEYYWHGGARGQVAFVAVLAALLAVMAGAVCFACLDGVCAEPARIEALQYAETRARRRADELQCLAENVYFEARGEPLDGQYAVAEVTLNRTHAHNFPHTVCAVVHEARWDPARRRHVADFSWTELGALSAEDGPAWKQALTVANAVYDDEHAPLVPGALFYHASSVRPDWARSRRPVATIGNHIFYR